MSGLHERRVAPGHTGAGTVHKVREPRKGNVFGNLLGGIQTGIMDIQGLGGGVVKGATGLDLSPEAVEKASLLEQAQGIQMGLFKGGIGGISEAFGMDPKMLLLLGVAGVVGIVVLLVVLK